MFDATEKPLITVKEARKLIGKEYDGMTDADIIQFIDQVSLMADIAVNAIKHEKEVPNSS